MDIWCAASWGAWHGPHASQLHPDTWAAKLLAGHTRKDKMTKPTRTVLAVSRALADKKKQPEPIRTEKAAEVATVGRPVRLEMVSPPLAISAHVLK